MATFQTSVESVGTVTSGAPLLGQQGARSERRAEAVSGETQLLARARQL